MEDQFIQSIKSLGYSEKETRVYLAALQLGIAKITDIAKAAGIKRPTAYLIIDSLIEKNLMTKVQKGKIDWYRPTGPKVLLDDQVERVSTIKHLLPELEHLADNRQKIQMSFYEGKKQVGFNTDMMFRSKELWTLVYLEEYWEHFGEQHNRHLFELLKRHGGFIHTLLPKTKKNIEYVTHKYRRGTQEVRFLPPSFDTSNKVGIIFNNHRVVFTSFDAVTAIAIEDEGIVKAQKQLWLSLWNQSLPLTNETRNES